MKPGEEGDKGPREGEERSRPLPMMALNHVSRLCRSVETSTDFYVNVLGFVLIERPPPPTLKALGI
ncbi:hypothetical protein QJS10_CPA05g00824 [Acorus calamus]|uniref:Glyoxalase/fosfomycin resistance/dioxygenase domain-containing protein n=1 Tax=Acorus calamus TaxID=4465 RepID=A0AAV9EXK5_ACOCL|nr:hypothetical protein QJS10_CPA05g00824 [Acorus calamus]